MPSPIARDALRSLRYAAAMLSALADGPDGFDGYEPLAEGATDLARRLARLIDPLPTAYTPPPCDT